MRLRRGTAIAVVVAVVGAVTAILLDLVANTVSNQSHWPGVLGAVHQHPWFALGLLGLVTVALTVFTALREARQSPGDDESSPRTNQGSEPPGAALVLRSLPRDSAAFTDRSTELEQLARSVRVARESGGALPVHVIDGMAGVGKTAFVVHAGHLLSGDFPDGQLFVNLNGHTPGQAPVRASEALASLLAASGVPPQQIPVGDDQGAVAEARAVMWRSWLAGKKAILVLDNAASYRQVEPLLPGTGDCLVLVTSRKRLAAHDDVLLQVDALPRDHAVDLFARLSGRPLEELDATVVGELVGLCGYLPLGVSLLAARLRHHSSWNAQDLRDRLVAARDRLGELRAGERAITAAFNLSYRDLGAEHQRFFRLLGFCPGPDLDRFVAAGLGMVPAAEATRSLDVLYEAHLIEEHPGGRYRFHDLLRDYARGLAAEGDAMDQVQAVQRVCTYYLAALANANRKLVRGGATEPPGPPAEVEAEIPSVDSRATALDWLENERANILACVGRANELALHSQVVRLAAAMAPFLRQSGPWDQAVSLHRAAAEAARRTGDRQALAGALSELGVVRRCMASYPEATEALREAVAEYEAVGDERGKADALNQAGIVWYLTADNEASAEAQTEALAIYRALGDRLGQANALADLGMVRRQTSRFRDAVEAQTEALAIYRELEDRYGEANSLRDLGVAHCLMGEYDRASQQHHTAHDIYLELNDRHHQAYALNELGVVRRLTGDLAGARAAHSQALDLFTEFGDRFGRATSVRHLGALERVSGNPAEAVPLLEEALDACCELGSRGGEAASLSELGAARTAVGDPEGAAEALRRGLEVHHELGDRSGEAEVLNHWGSLLHTSGEPAVARHRFEQALALARDINCPLEEARAWEGIGQCGVGAGDRAGTDGALREALAVYRRLGAEVAAERVTRLLSRED